MFHFEFGVSCHSIALIDWTVARLESTVASGVLHCRLGHNMLLLVLSGSVCSSRSSSVIIIGVISGTFLIEVGNSQGTQVFTVAVL